MKCPVDIEKLYNDYIATKNEENYKNRYEGREQYYHASGAGSCSRKLYYESIEQASTTNPSNERSNRILRLGTIVHEDLQASLSDTIYSTNINSTNIDSTNHNESIYYKEKEIYNLQKESFEFHIEGEIMLPELNVRGFYDLVAVSKESGKVYLIDFKTMASYSWSLKFGKKYYQPNSNVHQEVKLATYGMFVEREFGRLDGMWLYYYNKDTSRMKASPVDLSMLKQARVFWENVNDDHKNGVPMFRQGFSPVQDWNCNYCRFLDHCNPPFYKRKK